MKRQSIFSIFFSVLLVFSFAIPESFSTKVHAEGQTTAITLTELNEVIDGAVQQIKAKGVTGEWEAIGIARAGYEVPASYYENHFLNALETQIINASRVSITNIERLVIAASALGLDATNIAGDNLIERIYNSEDRTPGQDSMTIQGNNGLIFALIALDSRAYEIPHDSRWDRAKIVNALLANQTVSGGWGLGTNPNASPSYDITAMALIGLAPYQHDSKVSDAIQKAVNFLSDKQDISGGFNDPWVGGLSSEATSQVIIGLTSLGIDPNSAAFTKGENTLLSHLLSFRHNDGGFKHLVSETRSNGMATEQALQALVAYKLYLEGKGKLYQFPKKEVVKPSISVEGLEDGRTVDEENFSFQVTAKDGNGTSLDPVVTWNEATLPVEEDGNYTLLLTEGLNKITITATDASDNVTEVQYEVIYEKTVEELKETIEVSPSIKNGVATLTVEGIEQLKQKGQVVVHLHGDNVEIKLEKALLQVLIAKEASLQLKTNKMTMTVPAIIFSEDAEATIIVEKLAAIKQAYSHVYDLTIVQNGKSLPTFKAPVQLTFDLLKDDELVADKLAVYYKSNTESKEWEKVGGTYQDGTVTVETSHFSLYTVFAENELPVVEEENENVNDNEKDSDTEKEEEEKEKEEITEENKEESNKDNKVNAGNKEQKEQKTGNALPNTATSNYSFILIGMLFVAIGASLYFWRRPFGKLMK